MRRSALVALLLVLDACDRPPAAAPPPAITIPKGASGARVEAPPPAWHSKVKAAPADALFEWHAVDTGVSVALRALAVGSGVFAVGDGGTILRGSFPYREWTQLPSSTTERLSGVTCTTQHPHMCLAVGAHGTILQANAMGEKWTRIESGTTEDLNAVIGSRADEHLFYAVGAHGTILRSAGGDRWTKMSSETTDDLFTISNVEAASKNDSIMYAAGDRGTVLMLSDRTTWKRVDAGITEPIYGSDITLPNDQGGYHVFLVGGSGVMVHAMSMRGTPWARDEANALVTLRAPQTVWVADQALDPGRWPLPKFERLMMVAGAGGTMLVRNEPGSEWVRLTGLPSHDIYASTESGNVLLFAGANGSMLIALALQHERDRWKEKPAK